jgi:heptosyltransferase-3
LLGVKGEIPALKVIADPAEVEKARAAYASDAKRKVAVHISARRPRQRWPAERFAALIERLRGSHAASIMLLWSPGPANHPQHPGDDDKAAEILQRLGNKDDVVAYPTERLETLIGALAASDAVVCSDGGALHLAAALGKPIACFFGDTSVERWHPWQVPHRVLHAPSDNVADVTVEDALAACISLFA